MPRHQGPVSGFRIVLGVMLLGLVLPASAFGATAGVSGTTFTFTAASGEANDVVVETDGGVFRVIDTTAPVTAGAACSQRSVHRVSCNNGGVNLVRVLLADGDDAVMTLIGTTDADLKGGSGSDTMLSSDGDDTLTAGRSRTNVGETLISAGGEDTLNGPTNSGGGTTSLQGGSGDDQLLGGPGFENLFGDLGADLLNGGRGFDSASWGGGVGVTVTLNAGANDGEPGEGDDVQKVENLFGTGHNDSISAAGSPESVQIFGQAGNDTLVGGDADDFISGGDNADVISAEGGNDSIDGGKRADDISGGADIDHVGYQSHGQAVTVTINNVANDGINGGVEGDNVHTDVENLTGSHHNDLLIGSGEDNQILGEDGNDNVQGGAGDDELLGDGGNLFTSANGDDDLGGGDGDDTLFGGAGADDYSGGADVDLADLGRPGLSADLTVTIDNVADDGTAGEGDNVMDTVEDVNGGLGNDTIIGSSAANALTGGFGSDDLRGGNGPDLLDGETLGSCCGAFGADIFIGGGGSDTVTYASHGFSGGVTVTIGGGPDGAFGGGEGDDVQSTIENLIGSEGFDSLTGNAQANTIAGRGGGDTLVGGATGDHLAGNSGFDIHEGEGGKDEINSRDGGFADTDNCGSEADTAIIDTPNPFPIDTTNNCETVIQ